MVESTGLEQLLRHHTDLNVHHIEDMDILRVFHEHKEKVLSNYYEESVHCTMAKILIGIWFPVLLASAPIGMTLLSVLFHRLKARYPEVYASLGSPGVFYNNSLRSNWLFLRFIWGSHYKALQSRTVNRLCMVLKIYSILSMGWVLMFFILIKFAR